MHSSRRTLLKLTAAGVLTLVGIDHAGMTQLARAQDETPTPEAGDTSATGGGAVNSAAPATDTNAVSNVAGAVPTETAQQGSNTGSNVTTGGNAGGNASGGNGGGDNSGSSGSRGGLTLPNTGTDTKATAHSGLTPEVIGLAAAGAAAAAAVTFRRWQADSRVDG